MTMNIRIKQIVRTLALVPFLALATTTARAIEITAMPQHLPIPSEVTANNDLVGELSGSGSLSQDRGIGGARSPWTGRTSTGHPPETDREFLYAKVGSITFDLTLPANGAVPAATASFLWGSPDTYNELKLFSGGDLVATIVPGSESSVPRDPSGTYLVTISDVVFDELVFTSTAASFEFANLSVTPAFTGDLDCGESEVEAGSTLRRLNDVDSPEECSDEIPSRLDFDGETLAFLADYEAIEGAEPAFAFDVAWRTEWVPLVPPPQAIPYGGVNPPVVPTTTAEAPLSVQWFGPSPDPDPPSNPPYFLDYCPGEPQFDEDGLLVALEFPVDFDDDEDGDNDMSGLPGFQYGCLVNREVEIVADPDLCPESGSTEGLICVRVIESGYLRGDWRSTRRL